MMIRCVFLVLITLIFKVNSQTYLIHGFEENYPKKISYLKLYDFERDQLLASYGPVKSRMINPEVYSFEGMDEVFLFTSQRGGKLEIHVINKTTLALKGIIKTSKLTKESDEMVDVNFVRMINDNKELAMVVGSKGRKTLIMFDVDTLQEVFRYKVNNRNTLTRLSDDQRFIYFIEQNQFKNNKKLKVVNIATREVLPEISQGDDGALVYSFQHYLMVSKEVSLSKNNTTKYWQMDIHDLRQGGKAFGESMISNRHQQFKKIADGKKLLIANRTHKSPYQVKLFEMSSEALLEKKVTDFDVKLTAIDYFEKSNTLLLLGHKKVVSLNLINGEVKSDMKLPFTAENGIVNASGELAYISTENGSRMVMIDLQQKQIVNELLNNSLVKNVADVLVRGSIYYLTGVLVIDNSANDIYMKLNKSETKLFVRNQSTNQVSVYDAKSFSQRELINGGQDTFAMISGEKKRNPLVVLSKYKATLINIDDGTVLKQIKYDNFLSYNQSTNLLLVKRNHRVEVYSSVTGDKLESTKLQHANEAFLIH